MSTFAVPVRTSRTKMDLNSTQNLVDPDWELIDPVPDIHNLFQNFNIKFFNGKLACVELEWSKRMYQCAGICYSRRSRGQMSCIIRLSEPLLKLRSRKELIETLLHEMIHAFNFIRGIMEGNGGHGQNFISKMQEINRLAGTNITVYHSFHDEVALYKKHWWRCDGPCKTQKPYFGYVKRTSNRAPGPNDFWWSQHLNKCGGKFIKVKEPEKVEKKPKSKENKPKIEGPSKRKVPAKTTKDQKPNDNDIRKFFPNISLNSSTEFTDSEIDPIPSSSKGIISNDKAQMPSSDNSGFKLGGSGNGRSRLLDMFPAKPKPIENSLNSGSGRSRLLDIYAPKTTQPIESLLPKKPKLDIESEHPDTFLPRKSIKIEVMHEFDDDDDIILIDDEFDDSIVVKNESFDDVQEIKAEKLSTCNCPICNEKIDADQINQHLDECLTLQLLKDST